MITAKEICETYAMLNVAFKEWIRDFGGEYKIRCTEFSEINDECKLHCDNLDSMQNKKARLSQLVEMLNSGEMEIIGGRKLNKD